MKLTKKVSAASLAVAISYGTLTVTPVTPGATSAQSAEIAATRLAHHCNGQCNGKCGSEIAQRCNGQCNGKCGTSAA